MNPLRKRWSRLLGLCACVSLLVTVLTSSITPAQAQPQPSSNASGCAAQTTPATSTDSSYFGTAPGTTPPVGAAPACLPPSQPLPAPAEIPNYTAVQSGTVLTSTVDPVDLRVLVISADGTEADLPAITQALQYVGVPYTVYTATLTPGDGVTGGLTPGMLSSGIHGYYEGVILTTSDLVHYDPTTGWQSALSSQEWTNLSNYEATFHIRQITWYTTPTTDLGFNVPSGVYPTGIDTTSNPIAATFTTTTTAGVPSGKALFGSYVNTSNPLTIQYAYTYQYPALNDGSTFPVLTDASGNALAVVHNYKDASGNVLRQNLALAFDSNAYLLHDLVLSYGLVNWVTKGLFLGERHVYLDPQVDDVLIEDDIWPPTTPCTTSVDDPSLPTYRITGSDFKTFVNWQRTKQKATTTAQFRSTMAFNGVGSTSGYTSPDTLTPEVKYDQGQFNWVSHTYDHENLDYLTYITTTNEIQQNNKVSRNLSLTNYSKQNLIQPEVSGLTSPIALQAAYDNSIRYLVTDMSKPGQSNPWPNAGIYNSFQPSILEIPRHATNLYYNVGKPDQWLAEDNCHYPAGAYGYVGTYQALLDRESGAMLRYMLLGDMDPLMFHQTNLQAYDGTHSLLSDLLDNTLAKYNNLFTLPVLSAQMGGSTGSLGDRVAKWTQYTAVISTTPTLASVQLGSNGFQVGQPFTLTITAPSTLPYTQTSTLVVPVTGLSMSGAESYGGQKISHITLSPGQTYTVKGTIQGP